MSHQPTDARHPYDPDALGRQRPASLQAPPPVPSTPGPVPVPVPSTYGTYSSQPAPRADVAAILAQPARDERHAAALAYLSTRTPEEIAASLDRVAAVRARIAARNTPQE